MFLIIGLGNPGQKYKRTWHNLGFLAVDEFAQKNSFPDFRLDKKSNSLVSIKDNVLLAKPQTFMNESGRSVRSLVGKYEPSISNIVVVHDDADLPKGEMRISKDRGTAGHKGVESIINILKTKNFTRIRIGCRPKNYVPGSKLLDRFVLKKFTRADREKVEQIINQAAAALETLVELRRRGA